MILNLQKFLGGQAEGEILAINFDTHPIPTEKGGLGPPYKN